MPNGGDGEGDHDDDGRVRNVGATRSESCQDRGGTGHENKVLE